MKKLAYQLKSDLGFGLIGQWRRYLAAIAVMAIVGGLTVGRIMTGIENRRVYSRNRSLLVASNVSFGDIFCGFFGGGEPYHPDTAIPWALPVVLLLVCSLVFYLTLDYPYRDLAGMGKQLIVAAGSRWGWWLSKCAWVISAVSVFFALLLGVVAATCGLMGGTWEADLWSVPATSLDLRTSDLKMPVSAPSFVSTDDDVDFIVVDPNEDSADAEADSFAGFVSMDDAERMRWPIGRCIALVYLMLVALCLVQLAVSLLVGPLPAFGVSISIIVLSSWAVHPALLGNYLMVTRTTDVSMTGVNVGVGIALSVALMVACVAGGGLAFSRMDILGGERWAS